MGYTCIYQLFSIQSEEHSLRMVLETYHSGALGFIINQFVGQQQIKPFLLPGSVQTL